MAVVIIIGIGVQTIIILFIFSKRQINRFSLRGRRGPHVSVGQGNTFFRDIQGYPQIMRLQSKSKVQFLICCFDFDAMVSLRKKQCYCMNIDFSKCAQYIINRVSLITCRRSGGFITGPLSDFFPL